MNVLLDGALADGLREVALAGAAGAEEQRVFALVDEGGSGQVKHQTATDALDEPARRAANGSG